MKEKSPLRVGNLKMKIVKYNKPADAADRDHSGLGHNVPSTNHSGPKILKIRKTKVNAVNSNAMNNGASSALQKESQKLYNGMQEEDSGTTRVFNSNMNTSTTLE